MHSTQIHQVITQLLSVFYRAGFWHRGDQPTTRELRTEMFYCMHYTLFFISLAVGAITSEFNDESIFVWEASAAILVMNVKLCILVRKQKRIVELINRLSVVSIRNAEDVDFFNQKLGRFMGLIVALLRISIFIFAFAVVVPLFSNEKKMMVNFAFPLDYKSSDLAYWMALTFMATQIVLTFSGILFTIIVWYLMFLCSLRLTDGLVSFISNLFLLEFATSGTCICGSVYCLAFDVGENLAERIIHMYSLFYHVSELFMITYFGNEIMLASDRLSYKLFESNWIDQPQSTTKSIVVFGEYLKQSHLVMIGKLYPLTLETFTRILHSAYSFFNILKNTKQ